MVEKRRISRELVAGLTSDATMSAEVAREAFEMLRIIAAEGLCGMEVVEVSPPYDVNDNTSQLACRVILDVLSAMVVNGKLGHRDDVIK